MHVDYLVAVQDIEDIRKVVGQVSTQLQHLCLSDLTLYAAIANTEIKSQRL